MFGGENCFLTPSPLGGSYICTYMHVYVSIYIYISLCIILGVNWMNCSSSLQYWVDV